MNSMLPLRGLYRDVMREADGQVVFDSGWKNNTIVNSCRYLLAGFMRGDSALGIQYLAVGSGDHQWDHLDVVPPADPATTTDLVARTTDPRGPIARDALTFAYLTLGEPPVESPTPTSRLQITATLEPGYPEPELGLASYPLREFGLFGQHGSTDFMINCIRHKAIHKGPTASLIRVVQLYF